MQIPRESFPHELLLPLLAYKMPDGKWGRKMGEEGSMSAPLRKSGKNERGAGLVEYTLLVALVAMVTVASVKAFSAQVILQLSDAKEILSGAACGDVDQPPC
jgi:Flp pilus assembly pilin Flp